MQQTVMTKDLSKELKGIAILMMLWLHLFCSDDVANRYSPMFYFYNGDPMPLVLRKICSMCVPLYIFLGGFGLAKTNENTVWGEKKIRQNAKRVLNLYVNFWVVFLLFFPLGCIFNPSLFLASATEDVCNILSLRTTLNGAWWFLFPYAVLTLFSTYIVKWMYLMSNRKELLYMTLALVLYITTYITDNLYGERFRDLSFLGIAYNSIYNIFRIEFVFLMGICYAKHEWIDIVYAKLRHRKHLNAEIGVVVLLLLLLKLCIGASGIINPWFVFILIPLYAMMRRRQLVSKFATFMGGHSTNMWLCHFFYYYIFGYAIFGLKYPILIFVALVLLSLLSSYIINIFYHPLRRIIRREDFHSPEETQGWGCIKESPARATSQ